MLAVADIF